MAFIPGASCVSSMKRNRFIILRFSIIVLKIIDHFFDAYSVFRGEHAIIDKSPNIAVRCFVYVDTESGKWRFCNGFEWVFIEFIVGFGVVLFYLRLLMSTHAWR